MLKNKTLLGFILLLFLAGQVLANESIAVVIKYKGDVRVTPANSTKSETIQKGRVLQDGDKLDTGSSSFCAIKFLDDKSLLRIKEKSTCTIQGKRTGNGIQKSLFTEVGSFFLSLFKQNTEFKVTTPTSVASVKGTKFWVIQRGQSGETLFIITLGLVEVKNNAGKVLVKKGQTAFVESRSRSPQVRLTKAGDIPSDEVTGGSNRELDFEFTDVSGQKRILRINVKNQE